MNSWLIISISLLVLLYVFVNDYRRRIKKRNRGPKATSSKIWREMYSKMLFSVLPISPEEISEMYLVTFTDASLNHKKQIESYISSMNYNGLTNLMDEIPTYVGDFGEDYNCDLYDIIAIQKKTNLFYLAVVYRESKKNGGIKFESIKETLPIQLEKFNRRRLIYPI